MGCGRPKHLGHLVWSIAAWISICCQPTLAADASKDALAIIRSTIKRGNMTPYDVGSRYGQALGAAETCTGGKATDKAAILATLYAGTNLEEFNTQEKKIYDAWMNAKHCIREDNSSQCKVIIDESCAAAITEIGPNGSVIPGLFEISKP